MELDILTANQTKLFEKESVILFSDFKCAPDCRGIVIVKPVTQWPLNLTCVVEFYL